jgi:hypothetical protein
MKKVQLQFKVCPDFLLKNTEVKNAVKIVIIDPEAIFLTGLLGESGRKMVKAGAPFYFTKRLAEKLIDKKIARRIKTHGGREYYEQRKY